MCHILIIFEHFSNLHFDFFNPPLHPNPYFNSKSKIIGSGTKKSPAGKKEKETDRDVKVCFQL